MWRVRYVLTALRLLARGRIRLRTFVRALREWPIAVAGRDGAYVLDPDHEP